jgi:pilus assembly protein Flp/PilA
MWALRARSQELAKDESGSALIEYSLLVGLMAAGTITAVIAASGWVTGKWTALMTAVGPATGG